MEGSAPADVALLGLADFVVLNADIVDGETELIIETTATRAWCAGCGVRAVAKDRSPVLVRDVDAFGRRVRLRWFKRRWRCAEQLCSVKTGTEPTTPSARGCR